MGAVSENVACLLSLEALCRQPRVTELSCGEPQCSSERSLKTANKEVKDKHLFSAALCSCLSFLCGVYSRYFKKKTKINSHYQGAKVTKRAIQKDVKRYQIILNKVLLLTCYPAALWLMCSSSSSVAANTSQDLSILSSSGALKAADSCGVQLGCRSGRNGKKSEAHHGKAVYPSSIHQPQIELTRTRRVLFAIKYASPHLLRDHIICISLSPEVVTVLIGPRSPNRKWIVGRWGYERVTLSHHTFFSSVRQKKTTTTARESTSPVCPL